jgi:hypothetical protein
MMKSIATLGYFIDETDYLMDMMATLGYLSDTVPTGHVFSEFYIEVDSGRFSVSTEADKIHIQRGDPRCHFLVTP